jgi:hypothetical protein
MLMRVRPFGARNANLLQLGKNSGQSLVYLNLQVSREVLPARKTKASRLAAVEDCEIEKNPT